MVGDGSQRSEQCQRIPGCPELGHDGSKEALLTLDSAEIARGVGDELAVDQLRVAARSHIRQRSNAVEFYGTSDINSESRALVEGRVREVERHPAEGVDKAKEAREVDLQVVIYRDAEFLLNRPDQSGWSSKGKGGIDAIGCPAVERDIQVSGDRQERDRIPLDPHQRDGVGPFTRHALAENHTGVLDVGRHAVAVVGSDDQVVGPRRTVGQDARQIDALNATPRRPCGHAQAQRRGKQEDGEESNDPRPAPSPRNLCVRQVRRNGWSACCRSCVAGHMDRSRVAGERVHRCQ